MDELRQRCALLEGSNDALNNKVIAYERRVAELEKFQHDYRKAWGALNPDELPVVCRAEKDLLERDPVAFMQKNHDAVFCRERMEEQRKDFVERLGIFEVNAKLSESTCSGLEEEVAILRLQLVDQKNQAAIHIQRVDMLEEDLAVTRYHLKISNMLGLLAGERMGGLQRSVAELTDENRRLWLDLSVASVVRSEARSLPVESEFVCTRSDLDSVAASLYGQINELRARRK